MLLVDFEWIEKFEELEGAGRCLIAYATDSETGMQIRVAVSLNDLEDTANRSGLKDKANRKAFRNEQRKH